MLTDASPLMAGLTLPLLAPRHRAVCAWCRREVREGPEPTSHTICHECSDHLMREP